MPRLRLILICLLPALGLLAQQKAITEKGEAVWLYDDGTWKSAAELELKKDPFPMERPTFSGSVLAGKSDSKKYTLTQLSATKNNITDDADWFSRNDLSLPQYEVPNSFTGVAGTMPAKTPRSYAGNKLVQAFYSDKYNFFIYGKDFSSGALLLITDPKVDSVLHFLDFGNYVLSPDYVRGDLMFIEQRISWATIEDSVLYIAHSHNTYAASSKNMNAYITAIDLKNYKILWRSKPLVNNAYDFVLYGDLIVCGYGFTAEPDFLYTLDKKTGALVQTLPLKSGPSYIIRKNEKVFVRTYNTDYVFKISQ